MNVLTICWTNIDTGMWSWKKIKKKNIFKPKYYWAVGFLSGIVMHFQLIPRECGSLFALFYLRWLDAFRFAKCGTNPVFYDIIFIFAWQLPHMSNEHTKWDACHATQTCKNMAKWTTIYLFSLNIQHFIGHSLEYHNKILYTVCTTGGHKTFFTATHKLYGKFFVRATIFCAKFYSNLPVQFHR